MILEVQLIPQGMASEVQEDPFQIRLIPIESGWCQAIVTEQLQRCWQNWGQLFGVQFQG